MATTTVTLEPQNIAASIQSLKTGFAKANLLGVRAITKKGTVDVEMPRARLSNCQFSYAHEHCLWKTRNKKLVVESKGFAVEQQIHNKVFSVVFRRSQAES